MVLSHQLHFPVPPLQSWESIVLLVLAGKNSGYTYGVGQPQKRYVFDLTYADLNENIFPLDTNTYPVTKNIKAELAGVVIIAVFGVVSQMRVWKIVKEHRTKSAAQQLEQQQDQEREEESLGRKIEDSFQKERAQWEAAYAGKPMRDSSIRSSITGPKGSTSIQEKELYGNDSLEMVNLTKSGVTRSANSDTPNGTIVTVSVLNDDSIQHIDEHGNPITNKTSGNNDESTRSTLRPSAPPPPPVVIPLPFTIPKGDDAQSEHDNASVSAVPDSDQDAGHTRRPMSKRISDMSAIRSRISRDATISQEALIGAAQVDDDRASSIAATLDDDDDGISLRQLSPSSSAVGTEQEPTSNPAGAVAKDSQGAHSGESTSVNHVRDNESSNGEGVISRTVEMRADADSPQVQEPLKAITRDSLTISTNPKLGDLHAKRSSTRDAPTKTDTVVASAENSSQGQRSNQEVPSHGSQTEHAESHVGSLRDGVLPERLSKVALSYRTNEWAKHLEAADRPSLDEIPEPSSPGVILEEGQQELPAPVSAEIASPLLGSRRASQRTSMESKTYKPNNQGLNRSTSTFSQESLVDQRSLTRSPPVVSPGVLSRSHSGTRLDVLSPLPSNTLMGKRESLIKNRVSSQSFTPNTSSANLLAEQAEQETMSLSQRRQILQQQQTSPMLQHQASFTSQRKAPPSASQKWQKNGLAIKGAPPGFDSHQPKRTRSSQSDQKREQLYAGWRDNMRDVTPPQTAEHAVEQQRQALLNERRQRELKKQQREASQQQRASQMDSMMRSGQMLDAHREAMRKMQADANKRT